MCLRPRLPQLPVRHKPPPTLHPKQKKTFKRRIAKLLVSLPSPLVKHSSLLKGLHCKCASIHPCCENITLPFLSVLSIFVSPFSGGIGFAFIPARGLTSAHYVPRASARPSHACPPPPFCRLPRQALNRPFVSGTHIG